jgi:hypothetical protein
VRKNAFLLYNRAKSETLDRLLFSRYKPTEKEFLSREFKNPFLELEIDLSRFSAAIRSGFERWTDPNWVQDQYLVQLVGKIWLEGTHGWAIVGTNKLVYESLGFAHAPYVHKPAVFEMFFKKRPKMSLGKVISLRDTGEENYFHFFNDVVAKIFFLEQRGMLPPDATLVVGERLYVKPYFKYFKELIAHRRFNWYVQGSEWISVSQVILCKPFTHSPSILFGLSELFSKKLSPTAPVKLYLTRRNDTSRFVENETEVSAFLALRGFVTVDTGELSLEQQITLFMGATDVVAIHGAGLTNMLFRHPRKMKVIEVFHDNEYLPFHYIMLAKMLDFSYFPIRGKRLPFSGSAGFRVDINDIATAFQNVK